MSARKASVLLGVLMIVVALGFSGCNDGSTPAPEGLVDPAGDSPFLKGPNTVTAIYPVYMGDTSASAPIQPRSKAHTVLLTTLQGLLARQGSEQLYLYNEENDNYFPRENDPGSPSAFILNLLVNDENGPNIPIAGDAGDIEHADAWDIVDFFEKKTGVTYDYILYDKAGTDMQNIAVTLCGLPDGNRPVPVSLPVSLDEKGKAADRNPDGITDLTSDPDYSSYPDNYFNLATNRKDDLNSGFAVELDPGTAGGPRDYAVMLNGMMFYTFWDADRRTRILNTINTSDPLPVFGWDADPNRDDPEYNFLESVSKLGGFAVASDQSANLSLLSSTHSTPKKAVNAPALTYECGMKYVVFIMSDGDNLQLLTNNINAAVWWGSQYRGRFPVGWSISPAMFYLEPDVWNYFMDTATENDEFLAGPSTIGYVMGMVTDDADRASHFTRQVEYMSTFLSAAGLETAMIFGSHVPPRDDWTNHAYIDPIAKQSGIKGLFYKGYGGDPGPAVQFINGTPVVSFLEVVDPVTHDVSDVSWASSNINSEPLNDANKGFFAVYGVRNLRKPPTTFEANDLMGAFNSIYDALDKETVRVVTPSQFMDLRRYAEDHYTENTFSYTVDGSVLFNGSATIKTSGIPDGYTVEWFSDDCGGTLVPGGASPTVTRVGRYYGRMRPLDGGCPGATCVTADILE